MTPTKPIITEDECLIAIKYLKKFNKDNYTIIKNNKVSTMENKQKNGWWNKFNKNK